eukprot:COSAG01_NODE_44002_length_423_cov_2.722222_1_plen_117_part_01
MARLPYLILSMMETRWRLNALMYPRAPAPGQALRLWLAQERCMAPLHTQGAALELGGGGGDGGGARTRTGAGAGAVVGAGALDGAALHSGGSAGAMWRQRRRQRRWWRARGLRHSRR